MAREITDNIDALIDVLPISIAASLRAADRFEDLLEIILDLGRLPEARFTDRELTLGPDEVTQEKIDYVITRIGDFGDDNRAGIERTLHRISAIRNRKGRAVGLTCRVGRAVYGTIDIIHDIVESGQSILLLGRPGVGKTTMLREVARVLAEHKRVVIVDTSNEIGGDGDIPHPAIGKARRMQVVTPAEQHAVMIEAVENHMPEVIVIDEIGTELEASAARTIAERGVQLVGTAHGNTLDNLMMNPTLCDLVGGIQTVTLSDEEARRRGTQKSVLERKAPPTFDVVVEIQNWNQVAVRHDVAMAVDAILRRRTLSVEIRHRDSSGKVVVQNERQGADPSESKGKALAKKRVPDRAKSGDIFRTLRVYPYGASQSRLRRAGRNLNLPVIIVDDLGEADMLFTLRSYYRKRPAVISDAERRGMPVYVLRSNTIPAMETYLAGIFGLGVETDPVAQAMKEAQEAIEKIESGQRGSVELSAQNAYVRRQQHELARAADLVSRSKGKEPRRRVRIYENKGP